MINITTTWNGGSAVDTAEETDSAIMEAACKHLLELEAPNRMTIDCVYGYVELTIAQRGTFIGDDGYHHPSMHVTNISGRIHAPNTGDYRETYLTCINAGEIKDPTDAERRRAVGGVPRANNYKFYRLIPQTTGLEAQYGPIGELSGSFGNSFSSPRTVDYDDQMYWPLYYEKLSKGYKDESKFYLAPEKPAKKVAVKKADVVAKKETLGDKLFKLLQKFSKAYVSSNTTIKDDMISPALCKEARKRWNLLSQRKTVKGFNRALMNLMELSPRPRAKVADFLANDTSDFQRIIDREEDLLLAMEGSVGIEPTETKEEALDSFGNYGIKVYEATETQKKQVLRHIVGYNADVYKKRIVNIYRVVDERQQKKFNDCLSRRGLTNKDVKLFWHGSANANWLSILVNKLKANPGSLCASTHGKMLGAGNYFAPLLNKAAGYTSKQGSYWTHGTCDTSFAGLYAVAYGKPCMVAQGQHPLKSYTQDELDRMGYNCVHALSGAGGWLRNEEVCVFGDDAVLLNYLVEFKEGGNV